MKKILAECGICKLKWTITKGDLKSRLEKSKNGQIFCSKDCSAEHRSRLYADERLLQKKKRALQGKD